MSIHQCRLIGRRTSGKRKYPVADADNAHVPEKRAGRRYGYADRRVKDGGRSLGTGFARIPPNKGLGCQRNLKGGAYPSVNPTVRAGVKTANPTH